MRGVETLAVGRGKWRNEAGWSKWVKEEGTLNWGKEPGCAEQYYYDGDEGGGIRGECEMCKKYPSMDK